jgi:hypothetical protein
MDFDEHLKKLNERLDSGAYRAQFEYGEDSLRQEMLATADLLFEVADKVEEVLTDLMIRQGFPNMGGDAGEGQ